MKNALRTLLAAVAGVLTAFGAEAQSFLDSDFYCRTYGCVVVHDGFTFDVYDNYIFANGRTVAPDQPMIPWTGNPFQGTGAVQPVFTGTRTEGFHTVPLQEEGVIFGVDFDGGGTIDLSTTANQRGFLDESGVFEPFQFSETSVLRASEQSSQRSFYLTSRTDFYVAAQATNLGEGSAFNSPTRLADVGFFYGITRNGNDAGMAFGSRARNGNYFSALNAVDDLGDITSPTYILEFRNAIRRRSANSLPDQSVRFDYTYGFSDYDLSMGAGHLRYQIEFTFYNR
ncbi:MAG: hypothetical protein AAFQ22_00065 [Pseudomonadota bacterium]